ncbi:MAG: LysR family transcriptional regulator [Polyangiaceae bacterium]
MRKQSTSSVPRSLGDVQAMVIFARVVETRSFTAAARALDTTTSAVSKRIAKLEERLGARLIERTTRRVSPTDAGVAFYERCARILAEIDDAEVAVARFGSEPRGTLRASVPVIFGELYIAPLIPDFAARFPDVRLDISLSDRLVNMLEEGIDMSVRITSMHDSSLVARKLASASGVVVASPAYLKKNGTPKTPSDLSAHECIRYSLISAQRDWRFHVRGRDISIPVRSRLQMNHGGAIREAAIAGLGLARMPHFAVAHALRDGLLVTVLDEFVQSDLGVFAVYPAGKQPRPTVRAFTDFLAAKLPARLLCAKPQPKKNQ